MEENFKSLTTFKNHQGLFRSTQMLFGLMNGPATLQRVRGIIPFRLKWKFTLVYLDDVIIFFRSIRESFTHVKSVLRLLQRAVVPLKLKKCFFFQSSVDYFGHVVLPGKLQVAKTSTKTIREARTLNTHTELYSFWGLCNVYRRFVPGLANITAPLDEMLKKRTTS